MSCDSCMDALEKGMRFCPVCGEELREDCPACDRYRSSGANFCRECGKRLSAPTAHVPPSGGFDTFRKLAMLTVPIVTLMLIIEFVCLLGGTSTVLDWVAVNNLEILMLVPNLVTATVLTGASAQAYWVFLEVSIIASVAVLAIQTWRTHTSGEGTFFERMEGSTLYGMCILFAVDLFLTVVISLVMMGSGNGIQQPDWIPVGNSAEALYVYANAAVWEEVISRMVYIGIPMAVVALILRRRDCWTMLFGGFGMSRLAAVLIIVSGIIFGCAHGGGWGWEKIIPTSFGGFILGYAFVKYGIHVSIIMHFITDYMAVGLDDTMMFVVTALMMMILAIGFVDTLFLAGKVRGFVGSVIGSPNWVPTQERRLFRREKD